jgi:hypothetical protein
MPRTKWSVLLITVLAAFVLLFAGCGDDAEDAASEPVNEEYVNNAWTDGEDLSGTTVNIFGAFVRRSYWNRHCIRRLRRL